MGTRQESYEEALARRLALLRDELTGEVLRRPPASPAGRSPGSPADPETAGPGESSIPAVTTVPMPGRHLRSTPGGLAVPPWVPRALLAPGPVAVVAVVLALGLALTAWWALRSRPEPLPDASPVAAGLATPVALPGGSASASSSPATDLVVHVAGRVRKPGIVVLEPGDRVVDAIRAAGGPRPGVDLSTLNLARPLVDGEQILVGVAQVPGAVVPGAVGNASGAALPGGDAPAGGKVNLNTATEVQLEELPGVGPVTAAAIVAFRAEHGSFTSIDELLDVSGIGDATLAEIAPHATV